MMLRIASAGMPGDAVARIKTEATFESLKAVASVRPALAKEQGHRCAYCEQRIIVDEKVTTRIEHFHPQHGTDIKSHCSIQAGASALADAPIEWSNLLLCCDGKVVGDETCDVKKRNTDVCDGIRNPKTAPPDVDTLVEVEIDGRVSPRAPIDVTRAQDYLDNVLNLNHPTLVRNRLRLMNELRKQVGIKAPSPGAWSAQQKAKIATALRSSVGDREYGSVYLALARRYER